MLEVRRATVKIFRQQPWFRFVSVLMKLIETCEQDLCFVLAPQF